MTTIYSSATTSLSLTSTISTSTSSLSKSEKADALKKYNELEAKEAMKENAVGEYIDEVKSSLIFQYNWEELLGTSPMVINLIGACYIAASSPIGITVTLTPPSNGFKHLSHTSLRANLVECGNIGSQAFLYAKPQMSHIEMVSGKVFKTVNQIIACLQNGPQAKKVLKLSMAQLKRGAEDCSATALSMDQKFSHWLDYVCELHEVTVENESTTAARKLANETQLMAKQSQYEMTQEARESAKSAVTTLEESLRITQEAYKTASKSYPSGWEQVGQQLVTGLADNINTSFNRVMPALVENLNPVAHIRAGLDMFRGHSGSASSNSTIATGTVAPDVQVTPPDYSDPAYTVVKTVKDAVSNLVAILTGGGENGIDWDNIKATAGGDPKTGLTYCTEMLKFSMKNFEPSRNEPSVKLLSALQTCIKTATEVQTVAEGASYNWQPPAKDSREVKEWQHSVETASMAVIMIDSVASTTSRSRPPLVNPGNPGDSGGAKGGSVANAILNKASERLATTQKMYETSQENYQKSTEKLADVTTKMAEIAAELSKLKSDKITMTEIKIILTKCIQSLVTLKAQIRKLVSFFKALTEIVSYVEKNHVQPFLENVDLIAEDDSDINGFTYIDLQCQILFNATIMIRSYFGLFKDIAGMYVQSTKSLDEGFNLIDELALDTEGRNTDVIEAKQQRLQRWTSEATREIKLLIETKQREIKGGMEERVRKVADDSKLLPPPPAAQVKAIEQGKKVVTDAAAKGIEDYKPPGARPIRNIRSSLAAPE